MKNEMKKFVKLTAKGAVEAYVGANPQLIPIWAVLSGFFGAAAEIRTERAIEFIELFKDMPQIIINNENFQDGIINIFASYISQRNSKKRNLTHNLVDSFAKADSLEDFELERFNQAISNISVTSLKFLSENQELIEKYFRHCEEEAERTTSSLEEKKRWITINLNGNIPFSDLYEKHIRTEFGLGSKEFASSNIGDAEIDKKNLAKFGQIETEMKYQGADIFNELLSLGIMKMELSGTASFYFTPFGRSFLKILNEPLPRQIPVIKTIIMKK